MTPLAIHSDVDIDWLSRDSCGSHCDRRRDALQKDEEALALARDELMRAQREAFVRGLCKLNKDVKRMTAADFDAAFGCDVVDMIRRQMATGDVGAGRKRFRPAAAVAGVASAGLLQDTAAAVTSMKTPAAQRSGMGRPPMTRTARRGERILCTSMNGSPIDQFDHGEVVVTAKKRCGAKGDSVAAWGGAVVGAFPVSIGIGAGNGETIDLSDPDQRRNLDGDQKNQALQQLMAIQKQMSQLMEDF